MAERRMFAKSVIFSDEFTDMPAMARTLYFYLSMAADDDGFLNNPKSVQRMSGAGNEDMELLKEKEYIISFDSGVIAIKDWKTNNSIKKDRYKPTVCQKEKLALAEKCGTENKTAEEQSDMEPNWNQNGSKAEPQVRLGEDRIGEDSIVKERVGKESAGKGSVVKERVGKESVGKDREAYAPPCDDIPYESFGTPTPFNEESSPSFGTPTPFNEESSPSSGTPTPFNNIFIPPDKAPTLSEIEEYCLKERLTYVNSEIFFNHYDSMAWRYPDGTGIKNWRALLKKWNAQDKEKKSSKSGNFAYTGRNDNDDLYDNLFDDVSTLEV